ncbi:MAG: hypothetical protein U1E46_12955 [Hyphomicrobiales bacterium]
MPSGEADRYRLLHKIDLPPSYMSLGLEPGQFKDAADPFLTAFDAVISGPTDTLLLFKGEDVLEYDLRAQRITLEPTPIATVFQPEALPGEFSQGLDSAFWAGPAFPTSYFLVRAGACVRLEAPTPTAGRREWSFFEQFPVQQEFLRQPHPEGGFSTMDFGPSTQIHGLRGDAGRVHFFSRDGRYARHNLNNGEMDLGIAATADVFGLPAGFGGRVDIAFYGAGNESESLYLLSGFRYAEFDVRSRRVIRTGAIEERFPELALFIARPQLFLVEEYSLQSFVGPTTLGALVDSVTVGAQSVIESVIVTQLVTAAATKLQDNVVESASEQTSKDFVQKIEDSKQSEAETDSYQYRMNALFHGEAQAKGFWGGEVDANLQVNGGSDEQRNRTAQQAFNAMQSQTRASTQSVSQKAVTAEQASSITESVISKTMYRTENTSDTPRVTEFYEIFQKYVTLLVLSGVKGAYTDGRRQPEFFSLANFKRRLTDVLVDPQQVPVIHEYVRSELARIQDSSGEMRAIIQPDAGSLVLDGRVITKFVFPETSPEQSVTVAGIVKAAREFRLNTYKTRGIERLANDASATPTVIEPIKVEQGPSA